MEAKLKRIIAYVLVTAITFGTFSGTGSHEVNATEALTSEMTENVTDEVNVDGENEIETVGIEIQSEPTKTTYAMGEELDLSGLVVNTVYNDDSRVVLESTDYQVSGYDSSVMGEQTITVIYGDYSAIFTVNVWVACGTCGENLIWTLDEEGELRISGTGAMTNWGGVTSVPWYSYREQINTLVLEEGITNIGGYAFCKCSEITGALILPDSVTTIGTCAFSGCIGFSGNLVIPENVTAINDSAFSYCEGLEGTLILPDAVTIIGKYAFYKCNQLTGIVFGENVSSIKESAFANCSGVQEMIFKGTDVPYAGENTFAGMTALCKVKIPQSEMFLYSVNLGGHFSEQVAYIPITEEGEELELVGRKVSREIYKKNYLLGTELDKTGLIIYAMYSDGSEQAVKNYTLNGFDSETAGEKEITVEHAGYMTSFAVNVFENFSGACGENLTWTLNYDGTLTISGTGAMTEYASDSEVPWSSEKTNIKMLILSDELTTISAYAFNGCTNLTGTITIPASVTSIGNNAFTDCSKIIEVVFESKSVPTFGTNVFSLTMTALETIYVPAVAYDSYVEALSGMVSATAEFAAVEEPVVVIITHPQDQVVKDGETAIFTVEAEGTELKYQWQYSKNGTYWYNSGMEGSATSSLTVEGLSKRNGQQYRCVIKDVDGGELITEAATLTVKTEKNLTIAVQPDDQSVTEGETATFTIKVEGTSLEYQWQYSTDGVYWYDSGMDGAETTSLKVPALKKRNNQQYRCVIKDGNGNEVVTEVAVLRVQAKAVIVITSQPMVQNVEIGENAVFTVVAQGDNLTYQWQYSPKGVYWYDSEMEGADTESLSVVALVKRNGQQYRCVIKDSNGNEMVTEAAVLSVTETVDIAINIQPEDQTVEIGEIAVFTVGAEGKNLTYQWQYSPKGVYWYDSGMKGADTESLNVGGLAKRNGQQYRCIITDDEGNKVTSEAAMLIVN